ncbi:hypothetical protein [Rhodococcus kronopolitis]|uniref:Uncharacterized protein n=1 Tax=Rhodococcus kronopolitis TaxID=1460226 RepID=A0ABV9FQC5_9NOCA
MLAVAVTWSVLISVYYLVPARDYTERNASIRVIVGGVLLVVVLVWQIRRGVSAAVPELRAIVALGAVIALFLALFATTYLSLSHRGTLWGTAWAQQHPSSLPTWANQLRCHQVVQRTHSTVDCLPCEAVGECLQ